MTQNFKSTVKDVLYVSLTDSERKDYMMIGEHKIYLDTKFDAQFKACQEGIVEITNPKLARLGLLEGRRVWFHHFVAGEVGARTEWVSNAQHLNRKKLYKADVSQIFAYEDEDGNIVPINDYVFCEAIKIVKPEYRNTFLEIPEHIKTEKAPGYAKVLHASKKAVEKGIVEGDTILFTNNSDYEMSLKGQPVYCMESVDIMCVVNDDVVEKLKVLSE